MHVPHLSSRRSRRSLAVAAIVPALLLTACGTTDDPGDSDSSSSADAGAFPVTIDSALGSATIEAKPERVVTWGWSSQDAVLALGVVPVAMPRNDYGGDENGVLPWDAETLEELDAETPTLLGGSDTGAVPFEDIAAADPDVVLAPYSGLTQDDYDTLSKIAPVVAYPEEPWALSWQDQLEVIGRALGLTDEAASLQEEIDADIADLGAQHEELEGTSFLYAAANEPGILNIYREDDPRVMLLEQLGLEPSASIAELDAKPDEGTYFYPLSYENVSDIETDLLVAYFGTQEEADTFASDPVISTMESVREGHFAPIVGESFVMASSAPSVLSIPWMLEQYVPELADAVE